MVRALALFGAHKARVPAIETVYPAIAMRRAWPPMRRGAARWFTGMMAIHPAQVPIINAAFAPGAAEVAHARMIVAAFAPIRKPGRQIDGAMVDRPHLIAAQKIWRALTHKITPVRVHASQKYAHAGF
jgi:citrate lyase subunit beta/citryl-CoA lyase